jgi:ABC-type lipoprotein release transport system permease subunit
MAKLVAYAQCMRSHGVIIGAIAGLLPALRAARLSPTQALWAI